MKRTNGDEIGRWPTRQILARNRERYFSWRFRPVEVTDGMSPDFAVGAPDFSDHSG
jgi:hypothetical protein